MDLLAARQHCDQRRDALLARLGLLRRLHAPQHRVAVRAVQRREERPGLRGRRQRGLQVVGDGGGAGAVVGLVPAAVGLRPVDLGLPGGLHASRFDQRLGLAAVDLRPQAARAPWREALQPVLFVEGFLLAVDPAVAERDLDRLRVGDGGRVGARLGELQPRAVGA